MKSIEEMQKENDELKARVKLLEDVVQRLVQPPAVQYVPMPYQVQPVQPQYPYGHQQGYPYPWWQYTQAAGDYWCGQTNWSAASQLGQLDSLLVQQQARQ